MSPSALIAWTNSNIQAGSDTTGILLSAIFYYLLKNPASMARLRSELDAATIEDSASGLVTWKESQNLPYLDACIKEASRLHPPIAFPLERTVPAEGAIVGGQHLPGGTLVAMSTWVVNRDPETFGEDADSWRPERWLCAEEKRGKMYSSLLTVNILFNKVSLKYREGRANDISRASLAQATEHVWEKTSLIWRSISWSPHCCVDTT